MKLIKNLLNKLTPSVENRVKPTNSIFTLHPYKYNGIYVFDVPEWNTVKEAFVGGATEYLQILSGDATDFNLIFSVNPFPGAHYVDLLESDKYGSYYYSEEFKHQLWLCPYLFMYYDKAPERIFLKIENPQK